MCSLLQHEHQLECRFALATVGLLMWNAFFFSMLGSCLRDHACHVNMDLVVCTLLWFSYVALSSELEVWWTMRCSEFTHGSLTSLHFDLLGTRCHVLCMPLYFTDVVVLAMGVKHLPFILLAFSWAKNLCIAIKPPLPFHEGLQAFLDNICNVFILMDHNSFHKHFTFWVLSWCVGLDVCVSIFEFWYLHSIVWWIVKFMSVVLYWWKGRWRVNRWHG